MSDALLIQNVVNGGTRLIGPEGFVATLDVSANRAWATRLARVPLLEDLLKRCLRVQSFREEVALREEMAALAAQIETCRCGRTVGPTERCDCGQCPICESEHPCPVVDPVLESRSYDQAARDRW